MRSLRAGLIGLGVMGRHHARVLSSLEGVDFIGVAEPHKGSDFIPSGFERFDSLQELLDQNVDYCVVAVPTAHHLEVGLRLAESGIHALIEKPLAFDPEEAAEVTLAFERAGLLGAVGHVERYNPALQEARRRIAQGELGQILQVATRRQGPFPSRIADVGVVKDLATHDIDLTSWITKQQYVSVAARTAHQAGRSHEDLVSVVGDLSDGTVVAHLVNWLSPFKERTTVITGSIGAFVVDTLRVDLTYYANGSVAAKWDDIAMFRGVTEGDMVRYAFPKPEPLRTEHEAFRDWLLGREADVVTMRQGLATVSVADAVLRSAELGCTVTLDRER